MTYSTEKVYYYSHKKQKLLLLKCDGYKKNKNVHKKVKKLLQEKYNDDGFFSFNNAHFYAIYDMKLFV